MRPDTLPHPTRPNDTKSIVFSDAAGMLQVNTFFGLQKQAF